jgi:(heptosyl)LPS beta-1,4-glucosyltransferase
MMAADLIGVILTYNEAEHVQACIASLDWVDRIVVFDSFSEDDTVERARAAGADVIQHPFENYGKQREAALDAVDAEWVFFVDADERATPELAAEVRQRIAGSERGFWVPRHNYIFGRLTRGAGWYPDYQMRVLHRASARYDPDWPVHELVLLDGEAGYLRNPLTHHNYDNVAEFMEKQRRYMQFDARRRLELGMLPKPWTCVTGPLRHFWWRFVGERGYIDGWHGFRLSTLMAYFDFHTWRLVAQMQRGGTAGKS